jgi:DUF4097 and DUF4098 domain-containing protein YvlB
VIAFQVNADVTEQETFSFEVDSDANFSIDNVNGDIEITGGDGNTIEVIATKRADDEKGLDRIEIQIDASRGSVEIDTELSKGEKRWFNWGGDGASVTYSVLVPATVSLDSVDTVNGDVTIKHVSAEVSVDTVNGDIDVSGLADDAELDTVNGKIQVSFTNFDGHQRASCDTVNGSIHVYLPEDASASVNAESLNGSIKGGDFNLAVNKGRFIGRDMHGTIGSGSARLNLDTVNGSIRVAKN